MKAHARPDSDEAISQEWYVAEGKRGQQLLDSGQISQATEIFESILTRLGNLPTYARAVILGRLGRCFYTSGRHDLAVEHVRKAIDLLGRLGPSDGVKRLRGTLRSELGDALRASGEHGDAKKAYEAAFKIARCARLDGRQPRRSVDTLLRGAAAVSAAPRARDGGGCLS